MKQSRIEVKDALDIARQVASALSALEAVRIIHRDLKPENIMVQENGMVKVTDFSLAKILSLKSREIDSETRISGVESPQAERLVGTLNYMSPEQALGLPVDSRADIWALGVVLYEMLSGHLPFEQGSPMNTVASILKSDPIPLSRYSHVPDEIERIVNFALRKNPEERYQRAEDIALDLQNLRRKYEIGDEKLYAVRPTQGALSILSPPGRKLLSIAEVFFSPKMVTVTFKPLIADWQSEYFEALNKKRGKWHLAMISIRYYWYYAKACGLSTVAKFFKRSATE
jgi:serine/threonine protein kinase